MITTFLDDLVSLGLFDGLLLTFDGGFSVSTYDIVRLAFFALALLNVWLALKFLLKKVL